MTLEEVNNSIEIKRKELKELEKEKKTLMDQRKDKKVNNTFFVEKLMEAIGATAKAMYISEKRYRRPK